jgi:hypothetical protein
VTGAVPPVAEALHETAVPTVPVLGQVIVTVRAPAAIVTVAVAVAVFEFASVTVTLIVLEPEVEYVVEKLVPVPLAGLPPVAVHAKL